MTSVAIIYRDNDFFSRYVPALETFLQLEKYTVQTRNFHRDADSTTMGNETLPISNIFLVDKTFYDANEKIKHKLQDCIFLDRVFGEAMRSATEIYLREGRCENFLRELIDEAIKNGAKPPKKIVVIRDNLLDHFDTENDFPGKTPKQSIEEIMSWFAKIFPETELRLTETAENVVLGQRTWLVADRHQVGQSMKECLKEMRPAPDIVLRFPLYEFGDDLAELGLLSRDEKKFGDCLNENALSRIENIEKRRDGK